MALQKEAKLRSKSWLEEFPGDWKKLTFEGWDRWAHNFSGKMHCESMLGCRRSMKLDGPGLTGARNLNELRVLGAQLEKCQPTIGCSKACCLCCLVLYKYLEHRRNLMHKGNLGRIFPWGVSIHGGSRRRYLHGHRRIENLTLLIKLSRYACCSMPSITR